MAWKFTDEIWRAKPDDEVTEAATQLEDYTPEGQRIIRGELRRRGLPEPPPTVGPHASNHQDSERSDVKRRSADPWMEFLAVGCLPIVGLAVLIGLPLLAEGCVSSIKALFESTPSPQAEQQAALLGELRLTLSMRPIRRRGDDMDGTALRRFLVSHGCSSEHDSASRNATFVRCSGVLTITIFGEQELQPPWITEIDVSEPFKGTLYGVRINDPDTSVAATLANQPEVFEPQWHERGLTDWVWGRPPQSASWGPTTNEWIAGTPRPRYRITYWTARRGWSRRIQRIQASDEAARWRVLPAR